jgi:outer membrane protein TolC
MAMAVMVGVLSAWIGGCTPKQYAQQADKTGSAAVLDANRAALGKPAGMDITYRPLPWQPTTAPASGQNAAATQPGTQAVKSASTQPTTRPVAIRIGNKLIPIGGEGAATLITLAEAMDIGFRNSRDFQTQKELLFTQGLAVANTRRAWTFPPVGGGANGAVSRTVGGYDHPSSNINGSVGPTLLESFVDGGQLLLGSGLNYASSMTGVNNTAVGSLLSANFTQPLLQGAWRGLAYEPQYRAERDLLVAAYAYERYTQTFSVTVATSYYNVLQQRDQLENEQANIKQLKWVLALTSSLVEGGERPPLERDQAEQNYLNAQVTYEGLLQSYSDQLDNFKLLLGLPITARMELDPAEMKKLIAQGLRPMTLDENAAIHVAKSARPDVLTSRATLRDADRNVEIAADKFNPQLDVVLCTSVTGQPPRKWGVINSSDATRSAELTFNYSFDQTSNRDAYRNAIIAFEKARRDLDVFMDNVTLQVRTSYRALLQSRHTYEIQLKNVQIARRLQKLTTLQHQNGEVAARDVLDAEEALRNAEDGLTSALISYTSTRLNFLVTLGLINVDDKGRLHERDTPESFERIQRIYPYLGGR